jgi:hypothetical protein
MDELTDTSAPRSWRALPVALWAYLVALVLSVVVAIAFSTLTFHPTVLYFVIYGVLVAGLLNGSRFCRWLLTLLSTLVAYGLLAIQVGDFDSAGVLLVVLVFIQVALLCTPPARSFASHRWFT